MKRGYSTFLRSLCCVAVLAVAAAADEKPWSSEGPSDIEVQANCDLTGYKSEVQTISPARAIPDNNPAGTTVGPIIIPQEVPPRLIDDVIIDLRASHTFIGDLVATVSYDITCDGAIDASATILCRPGRASCAGQGSPFGCGTDLSCNNTYNFDDTAATGLGVNAAGTCTTTPAVNPTGCYKPTGAGAGPLSRFEGLPKGGCWFLTVADNAGADLGTICGWSVHIFNRVIVGVEPASWSQTKQLYN